MPSVKKRFPKLHGRTVKWENLPKYPHPSPSAELLCEAMYDVLGDVWVLLESAEFQAALPKRSHKVDMKRLREEILLVADRCEYLCKQCYGSGWDEAFRKETELCIGRIASNQ